MMQISEDEIEGRACAMFRRAWRKARNLRKNFALRYDAQGDQHTFKIIDEVIEQETIR